MVTLYKQNFQIIVIHLMYMHFSVSLSHKFHQFVLRWSYVFMYVMYKERQSLVKILLCQCTYINALH